ncbi:MAG: GxxExxY protein [Muribaculaceae bacterium]|nr:GxxExxY protein [Muribaculaceae bacterium]
MTAKEHNERYRFFHEITGEAMLVHSEYHEGLLESAYEAALTYLLRQKGYSVEKQVMLPMYWKDVKLDQRYCMDLVINNDIIVELKAISNIGSPHRRQLWNYMNLTHKPYGMLVNFGAKSFYSEWYHRHEDGNIEKITWRDSIQEMIDSRIEKVINSSQTSM